MDRTEVKHGIRWKLLVTMLGLIIGLVSVLTVGNIYNEANIIERELERRVALQRTILKERGTAVAGPLAQQAANDTASFNFDNIQSALARQVDNGRSRPGGLQYAILMNSERMAFAHTREPELVFEELADEADLRAAARTNLFIEETGTGAAAVMEFTVPVRHSAE